ncbi:MAG TPA: PP0621 family protein [Burkholderiaceae bacterium]|nr:PP0621 family protein [Burkholderiaceae bacterium]
MKFLLWLAVGAILVMWLMRSKTTPSTRSGRTNAGNPKNAESMLQCAHCGIHIPASEAVRDPAGVVFCSDAHRLQHAPH